MAMKTQTRIFVGYFRSDLLEQKIHTGLKNIAPRILSLKMGVKPVGFSGHVQWACLTFPTELEAYRAVKLLKGRELRGHQLTSHLWLERTSANERRRPNWRSIPWNGLERRAIERRTFVHTRPSEDTSEPTWNTGQPDPMMKVSYEFGDEVFAAFHKHKRKRTEPDTPSKAQPQVPQNRLSASERATLRKLNKVQ